MVTLNWKLSDLSLVIGLLVVLTQVQENYRIILVSDLKAVCLDCVSLDGWKVFLRLTVKETMATFTVFWKYLQQYLSRSEMTRNESAFLHSFPSKCLNTNPNISTSEGWWSGLNCVDGKTCSTNLLCEHFSWCYFLNSMICFMDVKISNFPPYSYKW